MYSKTALLTFVLMCCMLLFGPAWSQKAAEKAPKSQKATDWSLQFQIGDNFNLKSFDDAFFAAKKQISSNGAIRFGFDIRYSKINDINEKTHGEPYKQENDYSDFSLNLNCLYLYYPVRGRAVKYFVGAGPEFGYQKFDKEMNRNLFSQDSLTSSRTSAEKMDGHNWGIQLTSGVEWFVKSNISIHAEYFARAVYAKGSTTVETIDELGTLNKSEIEGDSFRFEKGGVRFGVSVYF